MATWKQRRRFDRLIEWQIRPAPAAVEALRRALLAVLDDCYGFETDRLRWRLHTAECAQDLWLLRSAVFQAVASQHCQEQAAQRIDGLGTAFRSLLPAVAQAPA